MIKVDYCIHTRVYSYFIKQMSAKYMYFFYPYVYQYSKLVSELHAFSKLSLVFICNHYHHPSEYGSHLHAEVYPHGLQFTLQILMEYDICLLNDGLKAY